ncbi:hypothetical protein ZWY2020_022928 [Hordeum vulgare]|nr:hypothetical protein ZWY2020_022928 [Hordeum vulgare]
MACIKSAQRPVLIASAPESPYLAAGTTSSTAVNGRFSASATIEIYRLDLESSAGPVWDLRKTISRRQEFVGHSKGATAISWCPYNSSFLLSCSKDNRTLCWDTISGKIINELPSSSSGIFDLHWCRNVPNVIAASSLDGKIGIYKFSSLDTAGKSPVGGPETIQSAAEYQVIHEVANRCSNKAASSLAIEAVLSAVPRKPRTPTTRTSSIRTAAVVKPTAASSIITRSMKCDIVDAHAVDFKHVLAVHTKEYFKVLLDLLLGKEKEDADKIFFGTDIEYCSDSKDAILAAAGAIIQGCRMVVTGQYKHAFAAIRPPGHHASRNKGSGFCFINNIALGARYLIKEKHAEKVMIVDFDYHHGDGTESFFFYDDRVLTFSIHRDGVYPDETEEECKAKCGDYIGIGKGEGFNVNVNLTEPYGDGDMLAIFKHILVPVVKSYSPDYILVSAGFDAALGDDVGDCKVTPEGYSAMTSIVHGHLLPHWPILKGHSIPQDVLKRLAAKPAAH